MDETAEGMEVYPTMSVCPTGASHAPQDLGTVL
jgi:hypothetical protein